MSNILIEPTATAQWHSLVHEAEDYCHCRLHEDMESYLVFLLMRFLQRPQMGARILATDYLEGLLAGGERGSEALREVGDHCLLFSGLFPQLAERRRVKVSYYVNLGRSAYGQLSERAMAQLAEMYQQLSAEFVGLMDVLQAIRKIGNKDETLKPLQAFDLWAETGSGQALESLQKITTGTVFRNGPSNKH